MGVSRYPARRRQRVFRRDSVEEIGDKDWNVYIDGFVVADGRSPTGIYDRNGTKTADLPKGWRVQCGG
ncbi:hypothetical protein [Nocardia abscessus]|uniref:hypothetical protein n=1 Tax=Nocardia abscessus TaxID=120957 RepID=UPI002458F0D2|nr:hypothetical protein [Nocardia abscessus]